MFVGRDEANPSSVHGQVFVRRDGEEAEAEPVWRGDLTVTKVLSEQEED